jgi:hypothetical protein
MSNHDKKKKSAKKKLEDMNSSHIEIIDEMIETYMLQSTRVVNEGIKNRQGRGAHKIRIDGLPYWIILAG